MTMLSNLARKLFSDNATDAMRVCYITNGSCEFYAGKSPRDLRCVGRYETPNRMVADSLGWVFEQKGARAARKWAKDRADIMDAAPWLAYLPMLKRLETVLLYTAFAGAGWMIGRVIVDLAGRL